MNADYSAEAAFDLSIVIVNWNTRALLETCLRSIYQTTCATRLEIIVVDNASSDGSVDMLRGLFSEVRVIQNTANNGFAKANNQGFAIARGSLILLLNTDTIVFEGTIDGCARHLQAHPQIGALGCRVLNADRSFQSSYFRFDRLKDLFLTQCLGIRPFVLAARSLGMPTLNYPSRYWGTQFRDETEVDVVAGCFLMTRSSVIRSVGALDEDFFFYGEEEEWCHRIKKSGLKVVYLPSYAIIHLHGASSKMLSTANLCARRARLILLYKTAGARTAWFGNLIMTIGAVIRAPIWMVVAGVRSLTNGKAREKFFANWEILRFHLRGLTSPIWIGR